VLPSDAGLGDNTGGWGGRGARAAAAKGSLDIEGKRARAAALETEASDASLWDDPAHGQEVHFDHVAYKPNPGKQMTYEVMLGWSQRNPTPLMTAFVETAKSVL